jgi:hypothetical protein
VFPEAGLHLWYELYFDKTSDVHAVLKAYRELAEIADIAPVYAIKPIRSDIYEQQVGARPASTLPAGANDPDLPKQWHYNNTGREGGATAVDSRTVLSTLNGGHH